MINKLKVGYFVISSRCLEITVPKFEEVEKKLDLSLVTSIKVLKEVAVQHFEEVEKKPAGFF